MASRKSELFALAMGAGSGSLIFGVFPVVVGAVIGTFGDPSKGGIVAAIELAAMGLGSVFAARHVESWPYRRIALITACVFVLGQLLSVTAVTTVSWSLMLGSRAVVGFTEGLLYSLSNAMAARTDRPDRSYTAVAFAQTSLIALFYPVLTFVTPQFKPAGVFAVLAGFAALALPSLLAAGKQIGEVAVSTQTAVRVRFTPQIRQLLVGFGIYSVGLFLLFPYVERVGLMAGFTQPQIATILALSSIFAVAGPAISAVIGLRFGRLLPITIAILSQVIASIVLVYQRDIWVWGGVELVSIMLIYVLNPYLYGTIASMEPTGRGAAYAGAIMSLTAAIGPTISSVVLAITHNSYVALGWVTAAVYVLLFLVIRGPVSITDNQRAEAETAAAPYA